MFMRIPTTLALAACALTAVAQAQTAQSPTAPYTTVGAQVFFDFSNISDKSNNVNVAPTGTGFDIKRGYLILDHGFDDIWSADLTTDLQYSSSTTAGSGGVTEVFIKKLYLQGKFDDLFTVHVGDYTSPWAPFVETLYQYRWIEKTQTDRLGFANTADWGFNASGAATVQGGNGFGGNYSVSVVDGGGYKNPTRTKYVDVEARAAIIPFTGLTIAVGGYSGHLGQVTAANENFATNTATRFDAALGYTLAGFNIGGEYFTAKNYKTASPTTGAFGTSAVIAATATGKVPSDEADGESVWASYRFYEKYSVFARYDSAKLSKDVVPNLKDVYWNAGVAYKIQRNIDIGLVYKNEKVTDGSTASAARTPTARSPSAAPVSPTAASSAKSASTRPGLSERIAQGLRPRAHAPGSVSPASSPTGAGSGTHSTVNFVSLSPGTFMASMSSSRRSALNGDEPCVGRMVALL